MKVLIVDDSIVFRSAIGHALQDQNEITKVEKASNGKVALDMIRATNFDVIVLDIEMPVMDGIQTIEEIRKINTDIKIIVFSSVTTRGAEKTLKALELGANEFQTKALEESDPQSAVDNIRKELLPKILALNTKKTKRLGNKVDHQTESSYSTKIPGFEHFKPDVISIGSSTGGPDALRTLISGLKTELPIPMVIIQHMPELFTKQLADSLNKDTPNKVKEAEDKEFLKPGHIYIAPGNYHLEIFKIGLNLVCSLNQKEKVCFVRPAVDVTYTALSKIEHLKTLAIILTGMGKDGTEGAKKLKKSGNPVIIQDEKSSSVWGMPGNIYENNLQDAIIQIQDMSSIINDIIKD